MQHQNEPRDRGRRTSFLLPVTLLLICAVAAAQSPETDPEPYREAIDRIDFLVGEWRGEGWMAFGPERRETFTSYENVEERLGGSVLLVEGVHRLPSEDGAEGGEVIHHALATISWSEADQEYRFASTLSNRDGGTFRGWLNDDGAFVWQIEVPGRTMRYVIRLDEQGRWVEDGEISMDGGENWFPFFQMTLAPVDG